MPQVALVEVRRRDYPAPGRIAAGVPGSHSMTRSRPFGRLEGGRPVHAWQLGEADGLSAEILDLGGILVGRFGNRIGGASYALDGRQQHVTANEGRNHLHGGAYGFGRRLWTVEAYDADRFMLRYRSPDGEEGYPGNLEVTATYRLQGSRLRLDFEATSDAPTPFNPTHHPYFNLAGDPSVPASAQWLQVPASGYLPVDSALIPLGDVAGVDGTPFDFRAARTLDAAFDAADPQLRTGGGFDHCLVLDARGINAGAARTATLYSPHSGIAMRIDSDAPALQLYDGHALDRQHPGIGRGLCLEPQGFPDAPNRPGFPDAILRPGTVYRRGIEYRFATPGRDCDWDAVVAALDRA